MMLDRFRHALGSRMGQVLTPELCAQIEVEAFTAPDNSIDLSQFAPCQCGSVTFHVERFADLVPELHPLHEQHWKETEKHRHGLALDLDYAAMEADDRAGRMLQFTARADGKLVGNSRIYIGRSRHTNTLFASEDTLYLLPSHRGGRTAIRFIQYGERCLESLGVREIRCTAKLVNGAARLFEAAGYKPVATELVKFIGGPQ
jgi:hypothetical protein